MSTLSITLFYRRSKISPYIIPICLWLTLSGSNYPYLEQMSMVPKMFEPLRFDCIWISIYSSLDLNTDFTKYFKVLFLDLYNAYGSLYTCTAFLTWARTVWGFHYENTPIQIYWKFHHQKTESFQIKILIFSRFCSKYWLWALVRTSSPRRF